MRKTLATIGLCLIAAVPVAAQVSPFDMSPERPAAPATPPAVVPQTPAQPAAPSEPQAANPPAVLSPGGMPTARPAAPAQAAPSSEAAPAEPAVQPAPQAVTAASEPTRRYLVPFSELVLAGEYSRRAWSIYLTPEQATARVTVNLSYQNAIVAAPEISRLRLSVNGTRLIEAPIASPDNPSGLQAEIPAGLLNAGLNDIAIEAVQRHRTDCSIESTYELWTQIQPEGSYLAFEGDTGRWRRVEDIRAIGVNDAGATRFTLVAPGAEQATTTPAVVRLAQALGLMANMPNQTFDVSETAVARAGPGEANIAVGTASELAGILAALPSGADTVPTVGLVDDPNLGSSTLVVTGPTWQAVESAVDGLARQVDRPLDVQRTFLASRPWRTPDVPLFFGAAQTRLADLGVSTLEFSGRRVRTEFAVGVPADFYANAYGEATILLDAAYSQEVLPGSRIDIYVNNNIAATVPITASGGEILRQLPIKVTMRHFVPGENVIAIEAVLATQADRVCAPGATGLDAGRFVLFDSTQFVMPDYARIGRMPELSGLGGTGFPYNRVDYAIPLFIDRTQPDSLSAAATLLARMALAAGRPIPVDTNASVAAITDKHAIFLNAISQVPPAVLAQVGVGDESRSTWGETVASVRPDTEATFDQWRERLRGSGWRGQVSRFEEWMSSTFNVSTDTFRVFRSTEPPFTPGGNASLLVASNFNPAGTGNWTLISAPTVAGLKAGVADLTSRARWQQLGGHITTLNPVTNGVARIPARQFEFFETLPFSLANYRLVAANWLSSNALSYGLGVSILAVALGLATAGLLNAFGRRE